MEMDQKIMNSRSRIAALGMLCVLASVSGQGIPAARAAPPPMGPTDASPDYVIGPGDALQIFVWRNPELTTSVPVRPDGKISTPLVEDMPAVGKTPTQLARDIEKVLAVYVKQPQVNVIVTQPASAFSQIKVIGQVLHAAAVPYRQGMTVMDAVLAVGGLTTFAAGNRAQLVRTVDGKQIELPVRLDALLNHGDMSQNLPVRPGDVLVVPESRF